MPTSAPSPWGTVTASHPALQGRKRQDNSHERRRNRRKLVTNWWKELLAIDAAVRLKHGLGVHDVHPPNILAWEVRLCALPAPGLDVVIPVGRTDLAARWIEGRLTTHSAMSDMKALSREIAPAPDEHLIPKQDRRTGRTRYASTNPAQDAATRAVQEDIRESARWTFDGLFDKTSDLS